MVSQEKENTPKKRPVAGAGKIVLIASGKGGVGKSTVAVNLACALAGKGMKTGLLDADLYGPSVQRMMGTSDELRLNAEGNALPEYSHGVHSLSMGNLTPPESPVTWKGALVAQALLQLFYEVAWPDLDVLVVDLPPGTGDIQLTILEQIPVSGALVVTTPQELAVADAERAIIMFHDHGVPVFGLVENMNEYICPCCGERQELFPSGSAGKLAGRHHVAMMPGIPLDPAAQEFADTGEPLVVSAPKSAAAQVFDELADKVLQALSREEEAEKLRARETAEAAEFWNGLLSGGETP